MDHYALQWLKMVRTGLALLHSTTSRSSIVQERPRLMWMASAGCRLIKRPQKMRSYTFASWKTRKKRGNSRKSSTPSLTSEDRHYGSSSATVMILNPVAAFALKSHRAVPSVRWVAIMATVRRRRGPFSPEGHGTRSQLTLWDSPRRPPT